MENLNVQGKRSFWYCFTASLGLSIIFFIAGYFMMLRYAQYTIVDSLAGALFVFFLAMIVSLSVIPPLLKRLK